MEKTTIPNKVILINLFIIKNQNWKYINAVFSGPNTKNNKNNNAYIIALTYALRIIKMLFVFI